MAASVPIKTGTPLRLQISAGFGRRNGGNGAENRQFSRWAGVSFPYHFYTQRAADEAGRDIWVIS